MIYVFTNRNITNNKTWIGDGFNTEGNECIRVAEYVPSETPTMHFYEELPGEPLPSFKVIGEVEASDKPCCIFIHGFNQDPDKNMKKCKEIESYGVNVIAFSWPSNPGPQKWYWKLKEYKAARQNARRSAVALERFFDKFNDYVAEKGSISNIKTLVVHSLGNYLFQSFVSNDGFEQQTKFLKNILLHQADVDSNKHVGWADSLTVDSRVLVTINETDDVLNFSDVINPDRLGNTLRNLDSHSINYFNFGRIPEADDQHRLWIKPTIKNLNAKKFFENVFTGEKVVIGQFEYDDSKNCYHVT